MTPRLLVVLAVLCVFATACSPTADDAPDQPFTVPSLGPSTVKADTPALRKAKAEAGIEDCEPGTGSPVKEGPPDLTLPCLGGGPDVNLATLRGPLIINTWGAWCDPCRDELPILAAFYKKYGDQVAMLGLDFQDNQLEAAIQLARDSGVTYPQVVDEMGTVTRTSVQPGTGIPSVTFIDAAGEVVAWVPGEIESEQELLDLVQQHLGLTL